MVDNIEKHNQELWEKGLGLLHDLSCQPESEKTQGDGKIIMINCHGSLEEIISYLKELVSKLDDDMNSDVEASFKTGSKFEYGSGKVVAFILK